MKKLITIILAAAIFTPALTHAATVQELKQQEYDLIEQIIDLEIEMLELGYALPANAPAIEELRSIQEQLIFN